MAGSGQTDMYTKVDRQKEKKKEIRQAYKK